MIEALLYILIGAFIGWNFPQPLLAKIIQAKVLNYINKNKA